MTTATAAAHQAPRTDLDGIHLGFARLVRSEWIKLRTIRSTVWCFAILFLVNIGLPLLVASVGDFSGAAAAPATSGAAGSTAVAVITLGVNLTSLVVAVLGALIITGEYATGMIRSTFTADPRRSGAFFAKALILAVATFVISAASTWIAALVVHPIFAGKGVDFSLGDAQIFMPVLGSSVYVTLLALLAFGIGVLIRTTAGGIAVTLGLLLVVPPILSVIGGLLHADWVTNISTFLPSEAGRQLYAFDGGGAGQGAQSTGSGLVTLDGWQGFGVLGAEVLALGIAAFVLVKRRDA